MECSPDRIRATFLDSGFVCSPEVATTLFLSEQLERPLLIEGPPGVGKTEIGKLWAGFHDAEFLRLQCYEGLDESRALYEWAYAKQMLYAQLLRERTAATLGSAEDLADGVRRLHGVTDAFFSTEFLLPRPLLAAVMSERPSVLLIDEIDRADEEFEAFLLEVLAERQVTVPELGTIRAKHPLRVVLTSNDSRELSDALRRRCLYAYVDYPNADDEARIIERRVPGIADELRDRVVSFAQRARGMSLRKKPGTAETLDWAASLVAVGANDLDEATLRRTLGALLKNREDLDDVLRDLRRFRE